MGSVYGAIAAVSGALAKTGISKSRENSAQKYKFRGIDEVFNALAPLLVEHGLVILPRVLARECVERVTKTGSVLYFVTVEAEFDFVAVVDGSKHTVKTFGEAQDSGDKATNKAMSAAYKYAAFQAFCIPTEGDNDADATTPEPIAPKVAVKPEGYDKFAADYLKAAKNGREALRQAYKDATPMLRDYLTKRDEATYNAALALVTDAEKAMVAA